MLQEQNEASKLWNTPTPGRRRLQTFRPESPEEDYEEEVGRTAPVVPAESEKSTKPNRPAPPPPLKPKPGMLRREKSDLGWVPLPSGSQRDNADSPLPALMCAAVAPGGPSPPQNSVEELRQSRLESIMGKKMTGPQKEVIARKVRNIQVGSPPKWLVNVLPNVLL